jgi:hypothetical protein
VGNNVVVLTTIRHPADTLLSYFHYAKWQDLGGDPAASMTKDGDKPGASTLKYATLGFAQSYAISLAWARLGAHVVTYENLLADPVSELRRLVSRIAPLDEYKIRAAALLCKPEHMTRPGHVDPRHIRTGTARRWAKELPQEIVDAIAGMEPYRSACGTYGYDFDRAAMDPPSFDYAAIDPFRGERRFDNGEPVVPSLVKIYLHEAGDSGRRWPDPLRTNGDSFWNWLVSPCDDGSLEAGMPPGTYTNLMSAIHRTRPDLQAAYPDPGGRSRAAYVTWFLGQALPEFEVPWALISPVMDAYCEHLLGANTDRGDPLPGRIERIAVLDASSCEASEFVSGDEMVVELRLLLGSQVARPVVGFTLRGADGRVVFGTNSSMLGTPLQCLEAGRYRCTIRSRLAIPPQSCYLSVGLAQFDETGNPEPIHRIYDHKRITVRGATASGAAWCPTAITVAAESC